MKKLFLNIIKFIMVFLIIISTMFIGVGCGVYKSIIDETSIESKIEEVKENSNYTELDNIYKTFLDAIVAIEDHRFYKHGAIDLVSIARALITNLENGQILEGGSTITQQVAKNIFLTNEQSFDRKIKEICIAQKLENKYTKEDRSYLPAYIFFLTDGDNFDKKETENLIKKTCKEPIFWQFVGLGTTSMSFLENLDDMEGREIDNVDFFRLSKPNNVTDKSLYEKCFDEYPEWVRTVRNKGIIK